MDYSAVSQVYSYRLISARPFTHLLALPPMATLLGDRCAARTTTRAIVQTDAVSDLHDVCVLLVSSPVPQTQRRARFGHAYAVSLGSLDSYRTHIAHRCDLAAATELQRDQLGRGVEMLCVGSRSVES